MIRKKLLTPVSVTALLTLALAFVIVQLWGSPLKNLMNEIFTLAIYGLLIVSYLLRIVLVFLGVFAVYRIIRGYVNEKEYTRMEV